MIHSPEQWIRLISDFADRKVFAISDALGELTSTDKKSIRSYYFRMGMDKREMDGTEFNAKYAPGSPRWIPDIVRKFYKL